MTRFSRNFTKFLPVFAAIAAWLGSTVSANAQSLGDMVCTAVTNTGPFFGPVFSGVAYIAGAWLLVQSIIQLKSHVDSPTQNKLSTGLLLMAGSALLLSLPTVISTIIMSIYTTDAGAGGNVGNCAAGAVDGGPGLDAMMASFVGNIKAPMERFCSAIAIACGLFMIVNGLVKMSKYGYDRQNGSINKILSSIGFGAILMTVGDNLQYILNSLFGNGTAINTANQGTVMGWAFVAALGAGSAQFANGVAAALQFVQIIGVIAFIRGWLVLKKAVDGGQETMAQGITHIIGGVLAINILTFLQIMDFTFGTNLL